MQLASRRLVGALRAQTAWPIRMAPYATDADRPAAGAPSPQKPVVYPDHFDASVSTLAARIQLPQQSLPALKQALTHKSFHHGVPAHNERMALLGHSMLRFVVTEHLYNKYPKLPSDALDRAVEMYVGPESSAQIARSLGINLVTLWTPTGSEEDQKKAETKVLFHTLRGVLGAIYHARGTVGAKEFVRDHVLSRTIDAASALSLGEPKRLLTALLKRQGRPPAQSRIIKETGRRSHAAMYLVGVYSGEEQLATGAGQSIKIAETVAAKNALQEHFMQALQRPLEAEEESTASAPPADTPPIV